MMATWRCCLLGFSALVSYMLSPQQAITACRRVCSKPLPVKACCSLQYAALQRVRVYYDRRRIRIPVSAHASQHVSFAMTECSSLCGKRFVWRAELKGLATSSF